MNTYLLTIASLGIITGSTGFSPVQPQAHGRLRLFAGSSTDPETQSKQKDVKVTLEDITYNGEYFAKSKPDSSWNLASANFQRQGQGIIDQMAHALGLSEVDPSTPPESLNVRLSNKAVKDTERRRNSEGEAVDAHPVSLGLYNVGCLILDEIFDERPIQRFWFLETIARIPYFSYVSMLHLYESFGWFRAVELRKVHAAEDWNELHHLLIMEALGGNTLWSDRFIGYHTALAYYWFLVVVYLFSPRIAYQFMELLEAHAVDTYSTFVNENREHLKELPAPDIAYSYYKEGDLYMFDDFQVSRPPGSRRPPCENLLDVFENICVDEGEHVKTMQACQDYAAFGEAEKVVSPHLEFAELDSQEQAVKDATKRQQWNDWSKAVNEEGKEVGDEVDADKGKSKEFTKTP